MLVNAVQFSNSFQAPNENKGLDDFHKDFYNNIPDDIKESHFFKLKIRIIPYKNIIDEYFKAKAIFITDKKVLENYHNAENILLVQEPKKISPSELAKKLNPFIKQIYNINDIKFTTTHLNKIAKHLKWIKDKQSLDENFLVRTQRSEKTEYTEYT